VPKFGRECVCCNGDPQGRTQDYDASTDRVTAPTFAVPVCAACARHAMQTHTAPIIMGSLLVVGIAATALGIGKLSERPDDSFLQGMVVFGVALTLIATVWVTLAIRRDRRERAIGGHHPRLMFSIDHGAPRLITTNEQLANRLLELNPSARRLETRAERKRLARARVLAGAAMGPDQEAQARRIAAWLVSGKPDDLDRVRAELATGTVGHVAVEAVLVELETMLGRSDLRSRYQALRGG
jgi:hypothetical protein